MSTEKILVLRASAAPRLRMAALGALFIRLLELVYAWHQHARARRELLSLSDHALKDIGISRATAERAAHEPFWSQRF